MNFYLKSHYFSIMYLLVWIFPIYRAKQNFSFPIIQQHLTMVRQKQQQYVVTPQEHSCPLTEILQKILRALFFFGKKGDFDFYNNNTALGKNAIIVLGQKERILQHQVKRGQVVDFTHQRIEQFFKGKKGKFCALFNVRRKPTHDFKVLVHYFY